MTDTGLLIKRWLKKNGGPRRIEPGASGNPEHALAYLRTHGWECSYDGKGRGLHVRMVQGNRKHRVTLKEFWRVVDEHRIADGLEPFALRAGEAT